MPDTEEITQFSTLDTVNPGVLDKFFSHYNLPLRDFRPDKHTSILILGPR